MKSILLFLITIVSQLISVNAQSVESVFKDKEMTWYGLDFSQAKFSGNFNEFGPIPAMGGVVTVKSGDTTIVSFGGQSEGRIIRDNYFKPWNYVILNEKEKYYLPEYYNKQAVKTDLSIVEPINAKVNPDSMMLPWGTVELTKEKIQEEVNRYDNKGKNGLGLVFIIESFNKTLDLATIHVTFFDMATNKVLLSKRLQTKPRGMGLRNYWATSIRGAMVESKEHWHKWKKEAGVKYKG
jgi:hypothetical protein